MTTRRRNPFAKVTAAPPAAPCKCPHGISRGPIRGCRECDEEESRLFRDQAPNEMRIVEASTGRTIATHRIPKGMRKLPPKGKRMAARPTLRPAFARADERPRLHMRLVEREGAPAIAYRSHPAAVERFAPSIELAMGDLLGSEIGAPAVIFWDGLTAPPRAPEEAADG